MALYSLNAYKVALDEGRPAASAAKFAREIATEMASDGCLENGPVPAPMPTVETESERVSPVYTRANPHPEVRPHSVGNYEVGSKYERGLDIAEIAKRLRSEIKLAMKLGDLPKGKYSVKIDRYSMGQSMDIVVKDLEPGFPLLNPERVLRDEREPHSTGPEYECPRYTAEGKELLGKLERMRTAWDYDRSHTIEDYHDVNYYGSTDVSGDLERRMRAEILSKKAV